MTPKEYRDQFELLAGAARIVSMVDVQDLLRRIERADSVGAMIDPTLYRAKHADMMKDKEFLEAVLPLWRFVKQAREVVAAAASSSSYPVEDTENPEPRS